MCSSCACCGCARAFICLAMSSSVSWLSLSLIGSSWLSHADLVLRRRLSGGASAAPGIKPEAWAHTMCLLWLCPRLHIAVAVVTDWVLLAHADLVLLRRLSGGASAAPGIKPKAWAEAWAHMLALMDDDVLMVESW